MDVKIHFRGPCLFVLDPQRRVELVVLPQAGPNTMPREGHRVARPGAPGQHVDFSEANVHYAGLLIVDANGKKRKRYEPLVGTVVVTAEGGSQKPPANLGDVVALDGVNNNGSSVPNLKLIAPLDDTTRVAAVVSFKGGKMDGKKPSKAKWTVHDKFHPGHPHKDQPLVLTQVWESNKPVTIDIGSTTERLTDREAAYVYNFDDVQPNVGDLEAEEECQSGQRLDDVDFNWLYQLVEPETGTLDDRLKKMNADLPRPIATCPTGPVLTPRTSTCFFASWGA
jgi:hypothetical protein